MWAALFIAIFFSSILLQLFILSLLIWGSAKLVRVPKTTLVGATKVAIFIFGTGLVITLMNVFLLSTLRDPALRGASALIVALLALAAFWIVVKSGLQSSGGKAAAITAITLLLNILISLPSVWAYRHATEAFVLPTGSMAPTIIGRHSHIKCQSCGLEFDVCAPNRTLERNPIAALAATEAICPNCFQSTAVPSEAPILNGDRFVVDKLATPKRWDNVAYWTQEPLARPRVAYCKRLVGLPNESLAIVDGDIFIDGHRLVKKPDELLDLWIPVHDTNFVARAVTQSVPNWQPTDGSSWKLIANRWKYSSVDNSEGSLTFNGLINDWLSYNLTEEGMPRDEIKPVGDLRVDCDVASFSGSGCWGVRWKFAGRVVQGKVTAEGTVELSCHSDNTVTALQEDGTASNQLMGDLRQPQIISLAIRDGWSYVLQNGHPIVSLKTAPKISMRLLSRRILNPAM